MTADDEILRLIRELGDSSQETLVDVLRLIVLGRWSGDVTLHCGSGGIRDATKSGSVIRNRKA